jgi:hypothetical protein
MPAMNGYGQFSGSHPTVDLALRVAAIVVLALAIFGLLPALAEIAG